MNKQITQEEFERLSREFDELNGDCIRDAKPKPVAVVSVPVSNADAEVIAANPESVRISARRSDGVTLLAKPKRNDLHVTVRADLVRELDEHGRPVWDKVGITSDYHPFSGLIR
jgi:hypothetical protein